MQNLSLCLTHTHTHIHTLTLTHIDTLFNKNWMKIANQTHAPIPYLPHKISRNDREDTFKKFKKNPREREKLPSTNQKC